ncbi:hypothetical protein GBA52_010124 [Prunus armeniaca]|nr:hypothetical protein GBA52_010124 [Prunus armeniaca]
MRELLHLRQLILLSNISPLSNPPPQNMVRMLSSASLTLVFGQSSLAFKTIV